MARRTEVLEGRVLDREGRPFSGLRVEARQPRILGRDAVRASGLTDAEGRFRLSFARTLRGELTTLPGLRLAIRDPRGVRTLATLEPPWRDVVLARADAEGWAVTLDTGAASQLSAGNAVRVLPDLEGMRAMMGALEGAKRKVTLLQLLFKRDFRPEGSGETLVDALRRLGERGVEVRVLVNDNVLVPDDVEDVARAFEDSPHVEACGFVLQPGVMHAKTLVVDDEVAFIVGLPFQQRFWDTSAHLLGEKGRAQAMPNHDLVVEVRGPAVRDVGTLFSGLWNSQAKAKGLADDRVAPPGALPPAGPDVAQVTRTLPEGLLAERGEEGSLEALLRALAQAQRFVYLENQYFTSGAFVEALRAAVEAAPYVDFLLVLNESTDVPPNNLWQRRRLRELGKHPNLGLFTLWSAGESHGRRGLAPVYVHSKVAIADDGWAMVGSANLDGVGLEGAAELALPHARSVELNLSVLDGVDGHPRTGSVARIRAALWAEHLGVPAAELQRMAPEGWLALWRRVARANLHRAQEGDLAIQGHVLPMGPNVRPSLRLRIGP